jgi:putative hemolysin
MPQSDALTINVREIIHSKAPKRKVPDFLIRYLEKIVHQDELNHFLEVHKDLYGIDFVKESVRFLRLTIHSEGLDKIPEGRYTFAGTHPLGGIDGLSTGLAIHERFPEQSIKFLSNDLLSNLKNLLPLFVPVNKVGSQSQHRSLPIRLDEAYNSNNQMVIFPAGKCSRRVKGKIAETRWTKSFIQKSIDSERDVVPVYFEGRNSNFFYNFANFRTFLGIKTNFEMLYLADEMFKQRGKTFHIYFGKPISYKTFDSSRNTQEWANWVREQALLLAKKL